MNCSRRSYGGPTFFNETSIFVNFMKNSRWWIVRAWNSIILVRWREFHCLAASRLFLHMTRRALACRVIRERRQFCERMPDIPSVVFGYILSDFSKCASSFGLPVFFTTRIRSGGAVDQWNGANELLAKELWWTNGFSWNIDFCKFYEKLTLVNSLGMKFDDFSSLARISLPCGVALVLTHDS